MKMEQQRKQVYGQRQHGGAERSERRVNHSTNPRINVSIVRLVNQPVHIGFSIVQRFSLTLLYFLLLSSLPYTVEAQGLHFSQYYNAPLLLNPANTALSPEADYRVGVNYRQQWASIPVPYTTYSAFGDLQVFRNRNQTNWLGLGAAVWSDVAGQGQLRLTRAEAFVAYHVQLGEYNMLSAGASVASVTRMIDFGKFTFDRQWDGFKFDQSATTGEPLEVRRTSYADISAGINYAFFPNERFYLKLGVGAAHLNSPKESFYGNSSTLGIRPTFNADLLLKAGTTAIINPSVYYTTQRGAQELVYGSSLALSVYGEGRTAGAIHFGAYHRWDEAIVGLIGYQTNGVRVTATYDYTISKLRPTTAGKGAAELSIIFEGLYGESSINRHMYGCPRF